MKHYFVIRMNHCRSSLGSNTPAKMVATAIITCIFFAAPLIPPCPLHAASTRAFDRMIGNNDALMIVENRRDAKGNETEHIIYAKNETKTLVPASTLKLLTALAAIHYLGNDYRYETKFFINRRGDLIIKGYGDPLLISEAIAAISQQLSKLLPKSNGPINHILLDDSFFQKPIRIPGRTNYDSDPYNAPNGALCANFNTIFFKKNPKKNGFMSAEPQTPLLPFAIPRIKATHLNHGRIILSDKKNELALYCGHLMRYFLKRAGIEVKGTIKPGKVSKTDELLLCYRSEYTIQQVIQKLLAFSNNFIANQLVLTIGANEHQPPGTIPKGVQAILEYAKNDLNLGNRLTIVEGSGLSRQNHVTAAMMIKILGAFKPYHHLMRMEKNQYYKTGTLHDIQTRVGYFKNKQGELVEFALMINTPHKQSAPIIREISKFVSQLP